MGWMDLKSERKGEMWHVAPVSLIKGRDEGEGELEAERVRGKKEGESEKGRETGCSESAKETR
jgi:hypothetical protein